MPLIQAREGRARTIADQSLCLLGPEFKSGNDEQIILESTTTTYLAAELRCVLEREKLTKECKLNWYREFWTVARLLENCRRPGRDGPDDPGEEIVITKRRRA
jgi:hypothetical protein